MSEVTAAITTPHEADPLPPHFHVVSAARARARCVSGAPGPAHGPDAPLDDSTV